MPNVPVTFPESYPFALLAHLPKSAPVRSENTDSKAFYNPGLAETAIVLLVLALSSPRKHLFGFFDNIFEIEGRDKLASLFLRLFKVASSILNGDAFPSNWLNVNILAHKVLIKMFDPIGVLMEREFIPNDTSTFSFDANLWKEGLSILLRLLYSEHLAIEEASHQVFTIIQLIKTSLITFVETTCGVETRGGHSRGRCCNSTTDLECTGLASRRRPRQQRSSALYCTRDYIPVPIALADCFAELSNRSQFYCGSRRQFMFEPPRSAAG